MMLQYNELANSLKRIRRFLTTSSEERQVADQRQFAYIACISALYSSFENFAERVAFSFCQMFLGDPANFSGEQLENLRKRYMRNASALLGQSLGVGRYQEITRLDVAQSLASFLDETSSSFDLRLELVALHSSNLRWDSLAELFNWAVPDLSGKIKSSDAVEEWMAQTDNVSENTLMTVLKRELDDLVERRNEVAHRAIPDEILSHEKLLAKVSYIEAISLGLVASLAAQLLGVSIDNGKIVPLGIASELFKDKRVAVIPDLGAPVSEGDVVIASGNKSTRWGQVLEIMVDDARVAQADAGTEVGLLLDFAVRKGANLHLWSEPNSDLVALPEGIFGSRGPFEAT